MKFSIKDFFSICDQNPQFMRIWSHLLEKSLMENFIFCAVESSKIQTYLKKTQTNWTFVMFIHCSENAFTSETSL